MGGRSADTEIQSMGETEEFCLQMLIIIVEVCPSNVDFCKCSILFIRNPALVLALVVLWKLNLKACKGGA